MDDFNRLTLQGLNFIPIPYKEKGPKIKDWNNFECTYFNKQVYDNLKSIL